MSLKNEDWREESSEFYRNALAFVQQVKALHRDDMDYFTDEMTEVLLDLKQAVIDGVRPDPGTLERSSAFCKRRL